MLGEYSHKTNKIIALAIHLAIMALLFLLTSCAATKINRRTLESETKTDRSTAENQNKTTNIFDRSSISEQDYSLRLIPIDPSKDIGHSTNPDTGEQQYRNAIPVFEKKNKTTKKDVTTNTEEAKTNTTNQTSAATRNETTKDKIKFSLPWYAVLILAFFAFATIIGLYFVYSLTKNFKAVTGTLAALENRLNKLEL